MRITYLHQYFNTPTMSGGTRSFEMGRRLVAMGHEVTVVTSARADRARRGWFETHEAGMNVFWLPVPYSNAMGFPARLRAFFDFALRSARRAAAIPADVVFATSTPLTIALPAVFASRRLRVPMVFEVRDLWPELPIAVGALKNPVLVSLARHLERTAYANAAHVVALSPGMRDGVIRAGVPQESVSVIPNASDIAFFQGAHDQGTSFRASFPWLGHRPLVVYVGTIGRVNGVGYLARLAHAVAALDPEICFLVIGEGGDGNAVRREAAELGVLDRSFFMLPPIPKSEVPAVLAAADMATSLVVDIPEMRNNSANKLFDALAAGTPLLINYGGWHLELLQEASAGFSVHGLELEVAAEMVVSRLRDTQWLRDASGNALHLARTQFDRDQLAADLARILESVCDTAKR